MLLGVPEWYGRMWWMAINAGDEPIGQQAAEVHIKSEVARAGVRFL